MSEERKSRRACQRCDGTGLEPHTGGKGIGNPVSCKRCGGSGWAD